MSYRTRIAVVAICCLLLFGTFVHHGAEFSAHHPYPENTDVATDYGAYVGEETLMFGTVQSVEGDSLRIAVPTEGEPLEMTVPGVDISVRSGGIVQVYGTIQSGQTIDPTRTVVVNESGSSELFKYVASVIGALLVLVAVFRHWRIDLAALEVRPRG